MPYPDTPTYPDTFLPDTAPPGYTTPIVIEDAEPGDKIGTVAIHDVLNVPIISLPGEALPGQFYPDAEPIRVKVAQKFEGEV